MTDNIKSTEAPKAEHRAAYMKKHATDGGFRGREQGKLNAHYVTPPPPKVKPSRKKQP